MKKIDFEKALQHEENLDPANWEEMTRLGHEMIDTMMDHLRDLRSKPVWQKPGAEMRASLNVALPSQGQETKEIFGEFVKNILPYSKGNIHPKYWAWVEGNGTPFGMLGEMLAAGMNPNLAIGDHGAVQVELQVLEWLKEFLGFPMTASGILVGGASLANFNALAAARNNIPGLNIRKNGVNQSGSRLIVYGSAETHSCVVKSVETLGLGSDSFIKIPVDENYRINLELLQKAIAEDRKKGHVPFCIIGNAGTVNTGAIDPLDKLADIAEKEKLWFHIDGAFGAFAAVVDELKEESKGMNRADSLAFDLHKWMCMPYAVACVLIKDRSLHRQAFYMAPEYLFPHERGLPAGPDPFSHYSIQLSKEFNALKVWMSLKEHGSEKYRRIIRQNIAQVLYLEKLVTQSPELEMVTPVSLNIACFRYNPSGLSGQELNEINKEILMRLHERGIAIPTYTILQGKYVIRVANVNHRSRKEDFEELAEAVTCLGNEIISERKKSEKNSVEL